MTELVAEEKVVEESLNVARRKLYILRQSLKPASAKQWSEMTLSVARLADGETSPSRQMATDWPVSASHRLRWQERSLSVGDQSPETGDLSIHPSSIHPFILSRILTSPHDLTSIHPSVPGFGRIMLIQCASRVQCRLTLPCVSTTLTMETPFLCTRAGLGKMEFAEEMVTVCLQTSYDVTHLSRIAMLRPRLTYERLASHAINLYAEILAQTSVPEGKTQQVAMLAKVAVLDDAVRNIEQLVGAVGVLRFDIRDQLKNIVLILTQPKSSESRPKKWYLSRSFKKIHLPNITADLLLPVSNALPQFQFAWSIPRFAKLTRSFSLQDDGQKMDDIKEEYDYKTEERRTHEWLKECGYSSWVYKDLVAADATDKGKAAAKVMSHSI